MPNHPAGVVERNSGCRCCPFTHSHDGSNSISSYSTCRGPDRLTDCGAWLAGIGETGPVGIGGATDPAAEDHADSRNAGDGMGFMQRATRGSLRESQPGAILPPKGQATHEGQAPPKGHFPNRFCGPLRERMDRSLRSITSVSLRCRETLSSVGFMASNDPKLDDWPKMDSFLKFAGLKRSACSHGG